MRKTECPFCESTAVRTARQGEWWKCGDCGASHEDVQEDLLGLFAGGLK